MVSKKPTTHHFDKVKLSRHQREHFERRDGGHAYSEEDAAFAIEVSENSYEQSDGRIVYEAWLENKYYKIVASAATSAAVGLVGVSYSIARVITMFRDRRKDR